jgi:hypothetical protein
MRRKINYGHFCTVVILYFVGETIISFSFLIFTSPENRQVHVAVAYFYVGHCPLSEKQTVRMGGGWN